MPKAWIFRIAVTLAALSPAASAAESSRFSLRINATERTESGVSRLSSDQVAVLDALVRRDTVAFLTGATEPEAPARFSLRLTADERRNAGLAQLKAEEVVRLDSLVQSTQVPRSTASLLAPPPLLSAARPQILEKKKEREIHGSVSLTYGWGGGSSVKSGSMLMSMEDPEKKYSVTIGYTETHVKGPNGYRGDYIGDMPGMLPYRVDPFRP
ncbi:MAG: hypothetical protein EXS38_02625 [Opitutus sp.]|nr:hypothetical protein [Opitutus sp.]